MLNKFSLFIKVLRNLANQPFLLVISFFITLVSISISAYTAIDIVEIRHLFILKDINFLILIFFTIENFLRLISNNSYIRSFYILDLLTILPTWILYLFFSLQFYDIPASVLLRGIIFLRLVPLVQILLDEKSFHFKEKLPSFFNKMISYLSLVVFLFIFLGSLFTSILYAKYIDKEKENRILQIQSLTKFYNIKELIQKVPPQWILKIEQKEISKTYEVYYINKEFLQNSLIPNLHFTYVEGKNPTEGILVSFLDLYLNKNYLETIFLFTSFFMIAFVYFIFYNYYRNYILDPIEKAYNVICLRIEGEEIEYTDLHSLKAKDQNNEIIHFIHKVDELYSLLREQELPTK